jgi:hypothetical protein
VPHQAAKAVLDDPRKGSFVPQNCIKLATVDFAIRHRGSSESNPLTVTELYAPDFLGAKYCNRIRILSQINFFLAIGKRLSPDHD